jgi:hypothetical protein
MHMHARARCPSPSIAVASAALFLALGGTGYAASTIDTASTPQHALRGPRGPRGPRGSRGFPGPGGPPGPAGANAEPSVGDIRTVYGPSTTVQPAGTADVFATCAAGERILAGGFLEPGNTSNVGGLVLTEGPAPSAPTSAWFVRIDNSNSTFALTVQVSAICITAT